MELEWEDHPIPEGPFFTRDLYEKYTLEPNIRELWAFLQSPTENANMKPQCDVGAAKASRSPRREAVGLKDKSCISSQESHGDSCDADEGAAIVFEETKNSGGKPTQIQTKDNSVFPEPRLPYPYISCLSSKEQMEYLGYLIGRKNRNCPQVLQRRVNEEVMLFTKYLQDVARMCSEDYNFISQGVMHYSEEVFRSCLECMKTLPQFYHIQELTSLTGGSYNPGLSLTFEKQLLFMGTVNLTDHQIVPADAQLALDYQSLSSESPPAKKAKDMLANVSSDGNAEKLCARYEPHVCLTRDALIRLLDNHGPDFLDQWELPVWIKSNPDKARSQRTTVYIDSPLLKTEVTVRERNHIYHEESLKLSIKNSGSRNVFHVMTEAPSMKEPLSPRKTAPVQDTGLDFDVDLTDLETFGETTKNKPVTTQKLQREPDENHKNNESSSLFRTTKSVTQCCVSDNSFSHEETLTADTFQPVSSPAAVAEAEQVTLESSLTVGEDNVTLTGDSDDDEKLVIDVSESPTPTNQAEPPDSSAHLTSESQLFSSSSPKMTMSIRQSKRGKVSGDHLGEILRMQTAMFKSSNQTQSKSLLQSPTRCPLTSVSSHSTSLVKPCVSSFLERKQDMDGDSMAASEKASASTFTTENKRILSQALQASAEDEHDYDAPVEGNLLYKLYSLQDLLLMVRSSISLTHTRNVGSSQNQPVPVHVWPKLEYQLSYGAETLTSSEACQLWTETSLHSSTVSYIAHINAHTSKVALLRKLPDDWKPNPSCGFKASKSLNILHHLLKKLSGLEEGQYLISHKAGEPFVTLFKAAKGAATRRAFNLQQVHGSIPQPPTSGSVPWIPVDPAVVLPFHRTHGRVPCTFPPKNFIKTAKGGSAQSKTPACEQKSKTKSKSKQRNKKKNRAAKRSKYMKKLIQKSV
ncbi:little elongation complex subunit 2 isoform X2 [Gouania willdenowi]|uniref:little elongation complex subunit 2 isoform X2 n=1 Tax=Gouania willdenowi TaxID=441366 RepID=UPI0010569601|nr:little elongation complex subunit 2 isoform X2 [Gouania willdenowi]